MSELTAIEKQEMIELIENFVSQMIAYRYPVKAIRCKIILEEESDEEGDNESDEEEDEEEKQEKEENQEEENQKEEHDKSDEEDSEMTDTSNEEYKEIQLHIAEMDMEDK